MKDRTKDIEVNEKQDLVKQLKAEFDKDQDHWQDIYQKAKEDLKFTSDAEDAQWDPQQRSNRISKGRPALTVDQLSQFIHQVVNDIRMNTPSINIIPDGSGSDQETAEVFKGLIRNIEYVSNADDAYDTATLNSVKCCIGYVRIDHDYVDDESDIQQLLIKRVINPLAVFLDRDSIEIDGSDAKRGTIIDKMKVSEFKKQYPGKDPVCFQAKDPKPLKDDDYIVIAEMFVIDEESKNVGYLDDGTMEEMVDGKPYRSKRKLTKKKVKRYKLSGADVLEETTFPGKYIPLVPFYGEEAWIEGKRNIYSLIRRSKDAQRLYNFMKSNEIEVLMTQPKAPWLAAEGQIKDKAPWLNPGNSDVLEYATTDLMGQPVGAPTRIQPPAIAAGFYQAGVQAVDDIKATLGMYNASIGQRSNEVSGKAIQARQQEGDVATFHFGDNGNKSIAHVGKILVCAIPVIYDTPRIERIIGEEDEPKEVGINGEMVDGQNQHFDLSKGKYGVRVVTGIPFSTRRQETVAALTELFQQQPQLMSVLGDIYFKNSDFSGASAMASRMEKALDPKFLDPETKEKLAQEGAEQVDPEKEQMKALIQQGAQELQTLQQELAAAKADTAYKQGDLQIKAGDLQLKQQELALKDKELQLKQVEAAGKFEIEGKKIEADVIKSRHQTKASASPDVVLTDPDLHESGVSPIEAIVGQLSQAITQQGQIMASGMEQLALAQQQTAQVLAQGNAQLAHAIDKPKSVVYSSDGRLLGVQ
jgi:hypothetical protein